MIWMDVDAAVTVPVNQLALIDDTDFKSRETGVAYNAAGMDLRWNFVTTAGSITATAFTPTTAGLHDWTETGDALYKIEIPASTGTVNNDTEGFGWISGHITGILPFCGPVIGFRAAALNNALVDGGDALDVNVTELVGVAQSATDLKDFADAGYDPATNKVEGVKLADTVTTLTGQTPQTADHTAAIADIPTVAEFNARTLVAASYFDPAADTVANVTTVGTLTGHTAQTGDNYATLAAGIAALDHDATLLAQFQAVISVIESQRLAHTHQVQGSIFYVDPVNGDTHANGNRGGVSDPYSLVQDCHDNAVVDSRHDLIILVSGAAAGVTTLTEDVTLTKRYLLIRGPGRDFVWTRTGNGDTITVTADGCELGGFQLETAATGSGNGIQATDADFLRVHHVWVNDTQGDGIGLLRCNNCIIKFNTFTGTGQGGSGQGIDIVGTAGTSNNNVITENQFIDTAGDAIQISGGTTNNTLIFDNVIEGSTAWGVDIGASSTDCVVTRNVFGNNTSGQITDAGTTSVLTNNAPIDGLSSLPEWLGALAGKQVADATALAEMQATGAGAGTYDPTTDSLEALRDNQGGGGSTALFRVRGGFGRSAANAYTGVAWLENEDGVLTTGVSNFQIIGVYGNNGDTDLVATGISESAGSDGRFYGGFNLTTQPTVDQPAIVVVELDYSAVTYRGHIDVAEIS